MPSLNKCLSVFLLSSAFWTTPVLSFAQVPAPQRCPSESDVKWETTLEVTNMAPDFKATVSVEMECKTVRGSSETRKPFKKVKNTPIMPDGRPVKRSWSNCLIEAQSPDKSGHFIVRLEEVQTGDSIVVRVPAVSDGYSRVVQFNGRAFSVESRWQKRSEFSFYGCVTARYVNAGLTIRE